MVKNIITTENIGKSTQIFINGVIHISLNNNDLKGLQSWKMGRKAGRFCSELYFVSDGVFWTMELEYDDPNLSREILNIIKDYV